MNKLTIPAILVATVMVAGIFAFIPVEQASTVHTTSILPGTVGLGCATEAVTLLATPDEDEILFTFTGEGSPILIKTITVIGTTGVVGGELIGFKAVSAGGVSTSVDTADLFITAIAEGSGADDAPGIELMNAMDNDPIYVTTSLGLIIDDTAADNDVDEVFTFEFCGLVSDPANFDGADIANGITAE